MTTRALLVSGFTPSLSVSSAGQRIAYEELRSLASRYDSVNCVAFVNELEAIEFEPDCTDLLGAVEFEFFPVGRGHRMLAALRHPLLPLAVSARRWLARSARAWSGEYDYVVAIFSQGFGAMPHRLMLQAHFHQHDILSSAWERRMTQIDNRAMWLLAGLELRRLQRWERRAWVLCNELSTLSEEDAMFVRSATGRDVGVLGVSVDPSFQEVGRRRLGTKKEPVLALVANFRRWENQQAARELAKEILPAVRSSFPTARVRLIGPVSAAMRTELANDDVEVLGFVDSVADALASVAVAVTPIRAGAGVKIKNLETVAAGIPTITTTIGAEGIHPNELLIVRDKPAEIATEVLNQLRRCREADDDSGVCDD